MNKFLVITGSYPPDICGVGDYTSCLINAANKTTWHLYYSSKWGISTFQKKIKEINSFHCNKIILQYPTQGYGWSLLPQLLCLYYSWFTNKTFIVVLHEFSQRTIKAKLATYPLLFANKVIFTNDFEKKYAECRLPFCKKRYGTIRILSNIKPVKILKNWEERKYDIVYFGHIRPLKGLEDFLRTITTIRESKFIKVAVIGQILPDFEDYLYDLKQQYSNVLIDYFLNNSAEHVASLLNDSKVVFLPFPDGISERRGSFLAAIANGALVMTYKGKFLTPHLKRICFFTSLQDAAEDLIKLLEEMTLPDYQSQREKSEEYFSKELPQSWNEITCLYEQIC